MSVKEIVIVRPKAWSMKTELRVDGKVVATLSGSKSFGRKAVAKVGDKTYVLSSGGKNDLRSRLRESGELSDIMLMEHTGAAKGTITIGGSTYELSRSLDGPWEIRSAARGLIMTFIRDAKDLSQGRAVMDVQDDNALMLALFTWFALRSMEC